MRDNFKERLLGAFLCPVVGHRWQRKMSGWVCRRCRLFVERRTQEPPRRFQ